MPQTRELERLSVARGDIILTSRGRLRVAVASSEHSGALVGANLVVIRLSTEYPPGLLAAYLRHPVIEERLFSEFASSATPGFSVEALKQLEVRLLPPEVALRFARLMERVDDYHEDVVRAASLFRGAVLESIFQHMSPPSDGEP